MFDEDYQDQIAFAWRRAVERRAKDRFRSRQRRRRRLARAPGHRRFQAFIYQVRPDVHSARPLGRVLCNRAREINRVPRAWNNNATHFFNSCALNPDDAITAIDPALGRHRVLIAPHHAAVAAGASLGEAAALHVTLEYVAEFDLRPSATEASSVPCEYCEEVRDFMDSGSFLGHT